MNPTTRSKPIGIVSTILFNGLLVLGGSIAAMEGSNDPISNILNNVPNIIDKVQSFVAGRKGGADTSAEDTGDGAVVLND